jgi:hypothetical protein
MPPFSYLQEQGGGPPLSELEGRITKEILPLLERGPGYGVGGCRSRSVMLMDARPDANEIELLKQFFLSEQDVSSRGRWRCSAAAAATVREWRQRRKATSLPQAPADKRAIP